MFRIPQAIRRSVPAVLLAASLPAGADSLAAFDADGLRSWRVEGVERLADKPIAFWKGQTESGAPLSNRILERTFDPETRRLTQRYDWGVLTIHYAGGAEELVLNVAVTNTGPETLAELSGLTLLRLVLPGEGKSVPQASHGVEAPHLVYYDGSRGSVMAAADAGGKPLALDLRADEKAGLLDLRVSLGGGKPFLDNLTAARPLPPGETDRFSLRVRLSGPGRSGLDLAEPELRAYREAHPGLLDWPDHRPILRLFFGGGVDKERAEAHLRDPASAVAPEPDSGFRQNLFRKIRGCLEAAKAVDAQGVILWDLEGETFPHPTTYIGDPRLIRLLHPQMELAVDEAVRMLREAGLHVGVTIRPSRVIYHEEKKTAAHSHTVAGEPLRELEGKIAYARERWGCRIFYIDTNYFWRPYGPEQVWQSARIHPQVWRDLKAKYPDTLFIPEFGSLADFQATAPYAEADMGGYGTPEMARRIWPEAFRVVVVEDADPAEHYDRFVRTARERNALMTFGQSATARNVRFIARFREEARLLDAGAPASVAGADDEGLGRLLVHGDLAERFHALRSLAERRDPAFAPLLLARAEDPQESWVVRHAALRGFRFLPHPEVLPLAMRLLGDIESGFEGAAAEALAGQGTEVDALLEERMATLLATNQHPFAILALGRAQSLRGSPNALPRLRALREELPAKHRSQGALKKLIETWERTTPGVEP